MVKSRTTPELGVVAKSEAAAPVAQVDIGAGHREVGHRMRAVLGGVRQELGLREGERFATLAPLFLAYPVVVLRAVRAGLAWVNGRQMPQLEAVGQLAIDGSAAAPVASP